MNQNKNNKRRKKFFNREILLDKLLSVGETSGTILFGLVLEFFNIAKAMSQPGPRAAQKALRKTTPLKHIEIDLKSKMAFWSMLSKLKKENLIDRNLQNKFIITPKGKNYLHLKNKKLPWNKHYVKKIISHNEIILVIFDIPEKERIKRDWIRIRLENFGFKVLQKSVWWGITGLPKEFLTDLKKYKILPYVHIFSVKKRGTISAALSEQFTIASDRSK